MTKRINSRRKGVVGELEFAHLLQGYGLDARRGQQFKGGPDSPDVICPGLPDVHFEVKRAQAGNLWTWIGQSRAEAPAGHVPLVAWRRNGTDWLAILPMSDMLRILILREINCGE